MINMMTTACRVSCLGLSLILLNACGRTPSESAPRIVGGDEVATADPIAKHTIFFADSDKNIGCSGVIVGPNQVLSAGHCWDGPLWDDAHVVFATKLADARFGTAHANTRRVIEAIHHEGFASNFNEPNTPPFDMALVTFEGTLPAGYEPVGIYDSELVLPKGTEVLLAGFGLTADEDDGSPRLLRAVKSFVGLQDFRKKEFYFGPNPGKGPCGFDSGGPAYYKSGDTLYLIGITSRGPTDSDTCLDGKALYTDVRFFQEWAEARGNFKMKRSSAKQQTQTH